MYVFIFKSVSVWMYVKCIICVPGAQGNQKRVSDPTELELQRGASCHNQEEAFR